MQHICLGDWSKLMDKTKGNAYKCEFGCANTIIIISRFFFNIAPFFSFRKLFIFNYFSL